MTLGLLVIAIVVLLLLRVPVALALILPSLVYVWMVDDISTAVAVQRMSGGLDSFPLLAVPLFILTGYLANAAGVADRLFTFLQGLFGGVRGSLGYVNVSSSVVFSWMSGAAIADAAGLGSVLVPAMTKRGYPLPFSLGITGASSMIGPIMPPSIPAIIYAVTAGVSVGAMFFAGVIPAFVIAMLLFVYVWWKVRKRPDLAEQRMSPAELMRATVVALPVLLTPVIVLGGILGGVFTPTEAAAVAVTWMLILGLCYRSLTLRSLYTVFERTARTTGAIMLIVAAAALFGYIIAREQGPAIVADAMLSITDNPIVFLLLMNLALLLIGMLLEPVGALLITVPVLLPVAAQFGIDPRHLGVIMILNLVIGLLTPPVGLVLYVLSAVTGASVPQVARGMVPVLVLLIIVLLIVTFFPALSLTLPAYFNVG